jgi:hypothetical protein
MDVWELLHGNLHDFDAQLWRGLTPSAYESCRDGFRLRYWRRPIWIAKKIIPHDRQEAERRWREILHDVVDRDVLWLVPILPAERKEQIGEPQQTMFSTSLPNQTFFIRFESVDHVTDVQMQAQELVLGTLDELDYHLWRGLPPSAYARLKDGFRLRLWRRTKWIVTDIIPDDRQKGEANWRGILEVVIDGDVVWLDTVLPAEGRKVV